jgi:hypothetical protein
VGRHSKTKGATYERETARNLRALWPEAKRGIGQARSAGEVADVEATPFWVECKRRRRCNVQQAFAQASAVTDGRPVLVVTKDDHGPELVTMELNEWLRWMKTTTSTP